jgi:rhodanese-related sulfurtransferase
MRHAHFVLGAVGVAFVSLVDLQTASACGGAMQQKAFKAIGVEQLAAALQAHKDYITVIDANNMETRASFGVIPGAVLLSHYARYDPSKELPADKARILVFYCANARCTAAPQAAEKAVSAGYTNVYVLEPGIMGWAAAGQPTTHPSTTS